MAAAGVDRALCICTTLEEFAAVHDLATRYDNFWASAGVHPDSEGVREPTLADLTALAALPRVVAIGETGLDYYRLNGRSVGEMAWQRERFRVHIRAARASGLPLVVHTRSAADDTLAILREEGGDRAGGVFHCFTETMAVARAALDLGFLISFSGILTFRNAAELREVARYVPLERCLIETDSPYLAPMPHRGKTNDPSYVPFVAAQMAQLKQIDVSAVAEATTANFERLFARVQKS
jgi:TatD DNase family protein